MKCPRCDYKHSTYDCETGNLVPAKMDVCVMCAYPIKVDGISFVEECCDNVIIMIDKFKKTNDRNYLILAEAYFKVAMKETKVDIPVRFEGSE